MRDKARKQSLTSVLSLCKGRGGLKAQRVTASQPSFVDGCPSRRSLVLGFLMHFRAKIRVDPWLKTSCVPAFLIHLCKSVFIRGSLRRVIRPAYCVMRFVSPHFGERMKVRGRLFGLAKLPFDA